MKITWLGVALLLSGCITTTSHYWSKPDLTRIQVGMTQDQVVKFLGEPETVAAANGYTYLQYGWDDPFDGHVGASKLYFVRIIDGKVDAFGEKGDFDTTKDPTIRVLTN